MARFVSRLSVVSLFVLALALPAAAQTVTGTLEGFVYDTSGGALPGATVTVRNQETGLERITTTQRNGAFSAPFLPLGIYRVTAELSGLSPQTHQNVPVRLNETTVQEFRLGMSASETITVSADAPRINVSDGEVKQTMTSEEVMAKPNLATGNFLTLAETFAGFNENPTSGQNNPTLSSGSSINFNGTGTRGATFQINGVNNDDSSENQNRQSVALATIKSFQVISNNYSAEFGRGYGAVVLVQTKSGTNDVRGEAYGYGRNNKWNQKTFFNRAQPKPINHRNEYGFTAGFPIMRDRLFAFVNADKTTNAGQVNFNREVPSSADLALPRLTLNNDTTANRAFQAAVLARFQTFTPNNAAVSARTFSTLAQNNFPDNEWSARVDWNGGIKNALTARYQRNHNIRQPADVIIGEQAFQNNRQGNVGVTWTSILSSVTVQEVRYGLGLRSTNVDISSGNDTPVIRFSGLSNGPIIGNAGAFPIDRNQRDNQLVYNLNSVFRTRHTLKAGADIRRSTLNDRAENFNRGFWTFGTSCGGVTYSTGYAAFMAGCVSSFQKSYGPAYLQNRNQEGNFYAQDDWRMRDNFTLNLGIRDEVVYGTKEVANRINYGLSRRNYVDPRLGFAYTPDWNRMNWLTGGPGRMSIRGGFGIFHGRVFQSIYSQGGASVRSNPPNALNISFANQTNISDPTNGFVFVPGVAPTVRVALAKIDPGLQMPETHQWNLTFERQIFRSQKVRLSYIGTQGRGLLQYFTDNLPVSPALGGSIVVPNSPFNAPAAGFPDLRGKTINRVASDYQCAGTGLPGIPVNATCPVAVPIADNEISLRVPRTNERRPDPRYTTNLNVFNMGKSWYHAGQVEYESGIVHGMQARATYTYSKTIDNGSEATAVGAGDINIVPPTHPDFARGLSRFDTRHRFTMNATYALPFFKDRKDWLEGIFGGWQASAVIKLASGIPFTIVDSAAIDIDFDGVVDRRPILIDKSINGRHISDPRDSRQQLPRSAFRRATPADKVDDLIGRNTFYTDGTHQVDLGLYKNIKIPWYGDVISLRAEVYNVTNRVKYGIPVNDINASNFGAITGTAVDYIPRTYQFGIRYIY
jgi:hypothetical protein